MAPKSGFFAVCAAAAMIFILGAALMGCGSSEEKGALDGGVDAAAGGTGGGATGGTGGGGTGGGGTGGATGGTGGIPLVDGSVLPTCDTTVVSATTCGTETCPTLSAMAAFTCQVNCCLNDKCGTRIASTDPAQSTDCSAGPQADPRCEDMTLSGGMAPGTRVGCCTADNQCGGISTLLNTCVSRDQLVQYGYTGVPAPRACDEPAPDSGA